MTGVKIGLVISLGFAVLAGAGPVFCQTAQDPWPEGIDRWVQGYGRTISGETISYHSAEPGINAALLVRAKDARSRMEWETAPVPADWEDPLVTIVWAAGLATGKGQHRFDLYAADRFLLSFRTAPDASSKSFRWAGEGGTELIFAVTRVDQFNELFGYMFLRLPAALVPKARCLRLAIAGEPAGSQDWVMTFQSILEEKLEVRAEPAIVRRDGRPVRLIKADITHFGPAQKLTAEISPAFKMPSAVRLGHQSLHLVCDPSEKETRLSVGFKMGGRERVSREVLLKPVRPWRIHLLPHSHVDIGYSDLQRVVQQKQWGYFEEAIALAERTAGYPPEAQFKWNVEILWAVESYLAQAPEEKRRRFVEAVDRGDIGLQAFLVNPLTGLCPPEELVRLTDCARKLSSRYGWSIDSAMITDIPGSIWSIVPALAMCGVRYYSSGPNYMPFLPDGGDRIGWSARTWGDRPFYWLSPSGREKVLFWMTGRGYSWFHGLNAGEFRVAGEQPIFDYLRELEGKNYPYDIVQVRYTIGGDNGPPDPALPDFVRTWNEEHESPKLIISTSSRLFGEFETRYGSALPEVKGDFTPYWEDGALSTIRETVLNREAADRLLQAETLWAMTAPESFPAERFEEAWRQVLLFDEHTWGAHNSVSEPDHPEVIEQWEYKKAFAERAGDMSRKLLAEAIPDQEDGAACDVYNTSSWPRSGLVVCPAEWSRAGDAVRDQAGRPVPSQRLESGELVWLASDMPPLAASRFSIEHGEAHTSGSLVIEETGMANAFLSVEWGKGSGTFALSALYRKEDGTERRISLGEDLNGYVYVPGRDPAGSVKAGLTRVTVVDAGPLVGIVRFETVEAPGCSRLVKEIRMVEGLDHLEIRNVLVKNKVREKESVHFAFPFSIPDGTVRADLGWGIIEPEKGQLAGACKDFLCVHNWVDVSAPGGGLTWVTLGSPLVEPGAITSEIQGMGGVRSWKRKDTPGTGLFSYAANI